MRTPKRLLLSLAIVAALVAVAIGCGSSSTSSSPSASPSAGAGGSDISGNVSIMAVWSGAEQKSFQAVIDAFNELYPNVNVKFTSAGDQLPTVLSTAVQGGNPPSLAAVAQPGLDDGVRESRRAEADRLRQETPSRRTTRPTGSS